ncbi:MAG: ATP-binding protein [Patescibacteria group bacterium]|nr:ATP-binding protein [Patescibacteria group bacterium]
MKTITILSGKGGVGKSTIVASLGIVLSSRYKMVLADCDVDAPNLALVFGFSENDFFAWEDISTNQIAVFDYEKCDSCKKCFSMCYFKAIRWEENKPQLKQFGCEGCGVCEIVCPEGAVRLEDVVNAKIGFVRTQYGFNIVSSQLNSGESGSGKLVGKVKEKAKLVSPSAEIMLVDAAAGIGCPVIASVSGSDYCILAVEPTPSSLFDMERAWGMIKHFNINGGIIINKFDINPQQCREIEKFARQNKIQIIGRLPYDKRFIKALVDMEPVIEKNNDIKQMFIQIADRIKF